MTVKEEIEQLRTELDEHNYRYYVPSAPTISDKEFDDKMRFHAFDELRLNKRVSFLSYDSLVKQYEMELEKQSFDFIL